MATPSGVEVEHIILNKPFEWDGVYVVSSSANIGSVNITIVDTGSPAPRKRTVSNGNLQCKKSVRKCLEHPQKRIFYSEDFPKCIKVFLILAQNLVLVPRNILVQPVWCSSASATSSMAPIAKPSPPLGDAEICGPGWTANTVPLVVATVLKRTQFPLPRSPLQQLF